MINSETVIHVADLSKQTFRELTVSKLFQYYSIKAEENNGISTINFTENDNVKITDWTGWTNIRCIKKISVPINIPNVSVDKVIYVKDVLWYSMIVRNKEIIIHNDTTIPVYDSVNAISGFHGEIKYPYNIKSLFDIKSIDFVRLLDIDDDTPTGFANPEIIPYDHHENCNFGYEIYTKSRFFNANDFHLFSSEEPVNLNKSPNYK